MSFVRRDFLINFNRLENELLVRLIFNILFGINYLNIAHEMVLGLAPLHENIWLEFASGVLIVVLGRWLL